MSLCFINTLNLSPLYLNLVQFNLGLEKIVLSTRFSLFSDA